MFGMFAIAVELLTCAHATDKIPMANCRLTGVSVPAEAISSQEDSMFDTGITAVES